MGVKYRLTLLDPAGAGDSLFTKRLMTPVPTTTRWSLRSTPQGGFKRLLNFTLGEAGAVADQAGWRACAVAPALQQNLTSSKGRGGCYLLGSRFYAPGFHCTHIRATGPSTVGTGRKFTCFPQRVGGISGGDDTGGCQMHSPWQSSWKNIWPRLCTFETSQGNRWLGCLWAPKLPGLPLSTVREARRAGLFFIARLGCSVNQDRLSSPSGYALRQAHHRHGRTGGYAGTGAHRDRSCLIPGAGDFHGPEARRAPPGLVRPPVEGWRDSTPLFR